MEESRSYDETIDTASSNGGYSPGVAALAAAQQAPQPVVRLGNFIEVGNDVFMHIIGAADIRYKTVENYDFEGQVRDRTASRSPTNYHSA